MTLFLSNIHSNRQISIGFYCLTFDWADQQYTPQPGQFITIRVSESSVPLLRRPFAFSEYNSENKSASIIYQKRGTATEILAGKKTGDVLDIIGPLGNTFQLPKNIKRCIIIAGGIGLGPMLFAAQWLKSKRIGVSFIFGCKDQNAIPESYVFKNCETVFCTDDGSYGYKGTTVDYLNSYPEKDLENTMLLCCGPTLMLKGCHEFAQRHKIPCLVSMEQIMACGVGACMGCVVKTSKGSGYARVCTDGPVFDSKELLWT